MSGVASRLANPLGELRSNRQFLRLLAGRLVTNAGDSLYYIAAMWLVYALTGSPLYTGIAGFLVRAPSAFGFLTGPLVDRWSFRRVLVGSQLINGILVLVVPIAAWTGHLTVWVILGLLPVVTLVNQFVYPAQSAALPRMVEDDNLAKANSLLSAAYQSADAIFNALSGILIAFIGAVTLFVVDSVTFGVALLLFVGIRVPKKKDSDVPEEARAGAGSEDGLAGYLTDLRMGMRYIRGSLLVALMLGVVVTNFAAGAMLGVLPAFAGTVGGAGVYGLLMAAYAAGSLTGTILASGLDDYPLGRFTIIGNLSAGVLLGAALVLAWFPATFALFFLTFVPVGAFNILFFTTLQTAVDDDLLGRVSSIIMSVAAVAIPVGSVVGGAVADVFGSRFVISWWAFGTVFFGLYFLSRSSLRSLPPAPEVTADVLRVGFESEDVIDDEVIDDEVIDDESSGDPDDSDDIVPQDSPDLSD